MNFFERIKFLSAISEMKMQSQPKQIQKVIISMTDKENGILFDMKKKIENMHEIQTFLSTLVMKVDENIETQCNIIDTTVDEIIDALQERRAVLKHMFTHEWKNEKLKEIENETQVVTQFDQLLKQELLKCEELLSSTSNNANSSRRQREQQMIAIQENIKNAKAFENYENTNAILNQLQSVAQCKRIQFQDTIDCQKISIFGSLQSSETKTCAELQLHGLRMSQKFDDHYHVEPITFSILSPTEFQTNIDSSTFEVRRIVRKMSNDMKSELDEENENYDVLQIRKMELMLVSNGNGNGTENENENNKNNAETDIISDDYKEGNYSIVDNDDNNTNALHLHLHEYKCVLNTSVNIASTRKNTKSNACAFLYGLRYGLVVVMNIEHPIQCQITSNAQCICVPVPDIIPIIDAKKETQIQLNIHSHKGHEDDYFPENILKSDRDCYLSPHKQIRNDWIILAWQQNANEIQIASMFHLTKVQVRHRGISWGLKSFRVWFGDADANEWIAWNDDYFVTQKSDKNLQAFHFPALNENKWKQLCKNHKKWKHFKLEIKNNHGHPNCILIQEFKLFGSIW